MNPTQPVLDICTAFANGRRRGLTNAESATNNPAHVYVNEELQVAFHLGLQEGQAILQRTVAKDAANPIQSMKDARKALIGAGYHCARANPDTRQVDLATIADCITQMASELRQARREIAAVHHVLDQAGVPRAPGDPRDSAVRGVLLDGYKLSPSTN
jgi:hypothetical protein